MSCSRFPIKIRFSTEAKALRNAANRAARGLAPATPYACGYCKGWHLTTKGERQR